MYLVLRKIHNISLMNYPRKFSFSLRSWITQSPSRSYLYLPYLWWGQAKRRADGTDPREGLVLPDTELMIDGFQGSANSFATAAFQLCQTRSVRLAHHRHAPIYMMKAVKMNTPVILTIREPAGTVISLSSRWPHISTKQGLTSYVSFYESLKPYSDRLIVSTFTLTTKHLDKVIAATNLKFGTDFDLVDPHLANKKCKKVFGNSPEDIKRRKEIKEERRADLERIKDTELFRKAQRIHEFYLKKSHSDELLNID